MEHTDEQLLDLVRKSDRRAFTVLYERHWRQLFLVAAQKLGDTALAEETAQDIFADIWQRRETLVLRYAFRTYLASALKYKVIDQLARLKVRQRYAEQALGPDIDDTTQEWLAFEDLQDRLAKLVGELPEKCRLVYRLKAEGHSYKEIAAELGIAEKTVESHLGKALRSIRSRIHLLTLFVL